jgi:hypothetical protein
MKHVEFKNIYNHEQLFCEDIKKISVIDGVEYLPVRKKDSPRTFLMRKDSLKKVSKSA